jgi:hypothetical protein
MRSPPASPALVRGSLVTARVGVSLTPVPFVVVFAGFAAPVDFDFDFAGAFTGVREAGAVAFSVGFDFVGSPTGSATIGGGAAPAEVGGSLGALDA